MGRIRWNVGPGPCVSPERRFHARRGLHLEPARGLPASRGRSMIYPMNRRIVAVVSLLGLALSASSRPAQAQDGDNWFDEPPAAPDAPVAPVAPDAPAAPPAEPPAAAPAPEP